MEQIKKAAKNRLTPETDGTWSIKPLLKLKALTTDDRGGRFFKKGNMVDADFLAGPEYKHPLTVHLTVGYWWKIDMFELP
ncbi:MAG: hypothetical protein NTZ38_01510 [Candidatus Taylorbacteria bacterium]|nr:hypothetical protein [Candidatus Taylorbacteria bacterium]